MCVFLEKDVGSLAEWDEYCHYVAGLVGIGLSRIFAASGLEDSVVGKDQVLANSMGLFLQKTNIIRDYLEDIVQGRKFWPKEVCVCVCVCVCVRACVRTWKISCTFLSLT